MGRIKNGIKNLYSVNPISRNKDSQAIEESQNSIAEWKC